MCCLTLRGKILNRKIKSFSCFFFSCRLREKQKPKKGGWSQHIREQLTKARKAAQDAGDYLHFYIIN